MPKVIIITLLLVSTLLFGLQAVKDTDFGWHYRCGEQLLREGRLCLTNEFSYYLPNYQAAYPSFLYDALLALTYDAAGFTGLAVLGAVLIALTSLLIFKTLKGPLPLKIASLILILNYSGPTLLLGFRPQITTFFFFALTLYLLDRAEKNRRCLYSLPFLFLLWVNTHIGFVAGLILAGAFAAEKLLSLLKTDPKGLLRPFGSLALAFLATLLNPFGWRVYQEIFNHYTSPLNLMIAEWVAPPFWLQVLIIFVTLELIALLLARRTLSLYSFISLSLFSFLAIKAQRNLPLFYLVFSYWLLPLFEQIQVSIPKLTPHLSSRLCSFIALLLLLSFTAAALPTLQTTWRYNTNWKNYCQTGQTSYPCETVSKYPNLQGNLFAMYEWGGFLIWQWPNAKVFADGRMPAWKDEYGRSPYQVLLTVVQGQPGWNEFLRQYKTDYILVGAAAGLSLDIKERGAALGWQEIFHGAEDAVLYRNTKPY